MHYICFTFALHLHYMCITFVLLHYICITFALHLHYICIIALHYNSMRALHALHEHYVCITALRLHSCITFALHLHYVCNTFALHLHYICITFALHLHYMCITCALLHYICITCALLHYICITLHYLTLHLICIIICMIFAWHSHYMHYMCLTFAWHLHYICIRFALHTYPVPTLPSQLGPCRPFFKELLPPFRRLCVESWAAQNPHWEPLGRFNWMDWFEENMWQESPNFFMGKSHGLLKIFPETNPLKDGLGFAAHLLNMWEFPEMGISMDIPKWMVYDGL